MIHIETIQTLQTIEGVQLVFKWALILASIFLVASLTARHVTVEERERIVDKDGYIKEEKKWPWVKPLQQFLHNALLPAVVFFALTAWGVFGAGLAESMAVTNLVEAEETTEGTADGKAEITEDGRRLRLTLINSELDPSSSLVLVVPNGQEFLATHEVYTYDSMEELQQKHPVFPDTSGYVWGIGDDE